MFTPSDKTVSEPLPRELEKTLVDLGTQLLAETQHFARSINKLVGDLPSAFPRLDLTDLKLPKPEKAAKPELSESHKVLFGQHENPLDAVKPEACTQPLGIGNCYFVAAMASMAKVNPQALVDMIKSNKDGTYTVKFPGASEAYTVEKPTKEELEQVGGSSTYGDWPVVVMKAFGKYCGGGKGGIEKSDGGSLFSAGVRVLTDKGVVNHGIGYMIPLQSWKDLDQEIGGALNSKEPMPVTASTAHSFKGEKSTKDGFVREHVYSVLSYKPNPDNLKEGKLVVRNPWGGQNATTEITLQQFSDNFFQLSIPNR